MRSCAHACVNSRNLNLQVSSSANCSQPPTVTSCKLFHIDETSDWRAVIEDRVKIEVDPHSEALWNVVYLPNATSPLDRLQEAKPEAAFVLRFSHTIIDGQSECCTV